MYGHGFFSAGYFGPGYFGPADASAVVFDGGGTRPARGALKRLKRKAEEERRRREEGWEAGLLAHKQLIEQVTRAMSPETSVAANIAPYDDEEEALEMLLLMT